jgi:hypothetical protein
LNLVPLNPGHSTQSNPKPLDLTSRLTAEAEGLPLTRYHTIFNTEFPGDPAEGEREMANGGEDTPVLNEWVSKYMEPLVRRANPDLTIKNSTGYVRVSTQGLQHPHRDVRRGLAGESQHMSCFSLLNMDCPGPSAGFFVENSVIQVASLTVWEQVA